MLTRMTHRGHLGDAPLPIIGGVLIIIGLFLIFATNSVDFGLMISGLGVILIGISDRPKLSFRYLKYTGPVGLALVLAGLLLFLKII